MSSNVHYVSTLEDLKKYCEMKEYTFACFSGTHCPACVQSKPRFIQMASEYKYANFVIIEKTMYEHPLHTKYKIGAIPTFLILDKEANEISKPVNYLDPYGSQQNFKGVLAEKGLRPGTEPPQTVDSSRNQSNVREITEDLDPEKFKLEYLLSKTRPLSIVFFTMQGCGACEVAKVEIEKISRLHTDLQFIKVRREISPTVDSSYSISSYPTFILFNNGEICTQVVGCNEENARKIAEEIDQLRSLNLFKNKVEKYKYTIVFLYRDFCKKKKDLCKKAEKYCQKRKHMTLTKLNLDRAKYVSKYYKIEDIDVPCFILLKEGKIISKRFKTYSELAENHPNILNKNKK